MDWFVTPPGKEKQLKVIKSYTEKTTQSNRYMPKAQVKNCMLDTYYSKVLSMCLIIQLDCDTHHLTDSQSAGTAGTLSPS